MYDNGKGVTQSYTEAVKYYQLAAAQGDADAQFNLRVVYEFGRGVKKNYGDACDNKIKEGCDKSKELNLIN